MKCPYCDHTKTSVIETRENTEGITRRRRTCSKCEKRFTTYERVEMTDLTVVKKNGVREKWDREKIMKGLQKACEKRPISQEKLTNICDYIERKLRRRNSTEAPSKLVGQLVMERLKKTDKVAYIRFASVYREFEDIAEFKKELKQVG